MTFEEHRRVQLLEEVTKRYVCAVKDCEGLLVVPWSPEENRYVLRCGKNKAHRGIRRIYRKHVEYGRFAITEGDTVFYPEQDGAPPLEYLANPKAKRERRDAT